LQPVFAEDRLKPGLQLRPARREKALILWGRFATGPLHQAGCKPAPRRERMAGSDTNAVIRELRASLDALFAEVEKVIVGQRLMVQRLLIGLLTGGHVLLEG